MLFHVTAGSIFFWPRGWWMVGAGAIVVSTIAIALAWSDAKFGMVLNVVALAGVVLGFLGQGPFSLRAAYDRDVDARLPAADPVDVISEADLSQLPTPVQRYLRTCR